MNIPTAGVSVYISHNIWTADNGCQLHKVFCFTAFEDLILHQDNIDINYVRMDY